MSVFEITRVSYIIVLFIIKMIEDDGWLAIVCPFKQYFSHIVIMKGCRQWNPFNWERFSPLARLEP